MDSAYTGRVSRGVRRGRTRPRGRGRGVQRPPPPPPPPPQQQQQQQQQQPYYEQPYYEQPQQQSYYEQPEYHQQRPPQKSFPDDMQEAASLLGANTGVVQNLALNYVNKNIGRFSWISLDVFRYYFHVSNTYVINKLKVVLFPCLHRRWSRDRNPHDGGSYKVPSEDLNAPDLYIPLMAFITYILVMGFIMGITDTFTPEVLGSTASWAMALLFFEVVTLRLSLYIIGSNAVPPPLLDLVAYSSYKFVILVVDLIVWILSAHNSTIYWITSIITGCSMAIFMARTLQRVFVARVESNSLDPSQKTSRQYFLLAVAVAQIPLCFFLSKTIARST